MKIYLILEIRSAACDWEPLLEDDGYPEILEAHASEKAAVAALEAWARETGAVPYKGGPEHGRRVSDGDFATYRVIAETNLVE